ncbi:tail protein X [Martelella mediterranea]|uniref:Phage tail protein X n=1 Tax=Martelella mediterranea TaxID=293089 RepID=A0A4V2V312_9HYPH|nr:tail protein X [Martelella mediterranea]TCT27927.1 phage tail protein X [Martelella mediterranea]TCT41137.1 phage tail protein X [Martelella mediterranea]
MTKLPATTIKVNKEDASLDLVCFEFAYARLGDRKQAGLLYGYVEATLAINPGLAALGSVLPIGTVVHLPEFETAAKPAETVRLWD